MLHPKHNIKTPDGELKLFVFGLFKMYLGDFCGLVLWKSSPYFKCNSLVLQQSTGFPPKNIKITYNFLSSAIFFMLHQIQYSFDSVCKGELWLTTSYFKHLTPLTSKLVLWTYCYFLHVISNPTTLFIHVHQWHSQEIPEGLRPLNKRDQP